MPPGTEFVGAQDFDYNEIWSLSFNNDEGGRYHADGDYHKLMYGAFSGPLIGPPGTAICVYPAYPAEGQDTLNNGIFDIFQGDVAISDPATGENTERQNTFVECAPQGRDEGDEAEDIQIIKDISQLGDNPLLVLHGVHVSQMVVDQICVVKRNNPHICVNQDILFLGTNTGLVYKVVMATMSTSNSGVLEPVIVDEIKLDEGMDDTIGVDEMKLEMVDNEKFLYVGTASRIYRLPLENCGRYGANFSACVGSRDPYCVWDSVNVTCRRSSLLSINGSAAAVPSSVSQNIHTGMVDEPEVSFTQSDFVVSETQGQLEVTITASSRVSDGVLEMVAMDGTARAGTDFELTSPQTVNFPSSNMTTVIINILQRSGFNGNTWFTLSLRSSGAGALNFNIGRATVNILDQEALLFQLAIGRLGTQTCQRWILFDRDGKVTAITNAVLSALNPTLKPEDNIDIFQQSSLSCTDKLSANDQEFAVFRSIIDLTKLRTTRDQAISLLNKWITSSPTPTINDDGTEYAVLRDDGCNSVLLSLDDPYCTYDNLIGDTAPLAPSASTGDATAALGAIVGLLAVLCVVLPVVVGLLVWWIIRKKSSGRFTPAQDPHTPNTASALTKFQFPPGENNTDSNGKENVDKVAL